MKKIMRELTVAVVFTAALYFLIGFGFGYNTLAHDPELQQNLHEFKAVDWKNTCRWVPTAGNQGRKFFSCGDATEKFLEKRNARLEKIKNQYGNCLAGAKYELYLYDQKIPSREIRGMDLCWPLRVLKSYGQTIPPASPAQPAGEVSHNGLASTTGLSAK